MKRFNPKLLSLAVGMALTGQAGAGAIDFTGSNIYYKFLDGNQRYEDTNSTFGNSLGDNGSDQGQAFELELRMKARISDQVEAGARIKSRFLRNFWTTNSFGHETEDSALQSNKYMKLRGAYVNLTPGYSWLNFARIGSSDWGMFDPFTMGKIRYTDRDNFNGFYFRGPLASGSWELARVSLLEYLGPNYSTREDANTSLMANDAAYVVQIKQPLGDVNVTAIGETVRDKEKDLSDSDPFNGQATVNRFRNNIIGLKVDTSIMDTVDLRLAAYHSKYEVNTDLTTVQTWSMLLGDDYDDNAIMLNLDVLETGIKNLGFSFQYFNIGEGYVSTTGARRESDVLLTDGSEAAWYGWGPTPWGSVDTRWIGGLANDMQQVVVNHVDNDFMDFDETGAESVVGWKGFTLLANYEVADTPMSLEYTRVDYNTNWQDWDGEQSTFEVCQYCMNNNPNIATFREDQDRNTDIIVFKADHIFDVMGGLDTNLKVKHIKDEDNRSDGTSADNRETKDTGIVIGVGTQLMSDLYGGLSYGHYRRDITVGSTDFDNKKDILSARFNYNLSGFEAGLLAQWINGEGDMNEDGTEEDVSQYRMKIYAKVLF